MQHQIVLTNVDEAVRQSLLERCKAWASAHQAEVGVAEMALGAALLAWGVSNGDVLMGEHIVASKLAGIGGKFGLAGGAAVGATLAASVLKGLFFGGVATVQGTVAVPALVLIGGASLVLGAFGYTGADLLGKLVDPSLGEVLGTASVLAIGLALLVDGARRFVKDKRVLAATARFADGVVHLVKRAGVIVARTRDELEKLAQAFWASPAPASALGAGGAAAGATLGASVAAGSVTVLGSHTLGAAALSLGLVSAPIWPIVVGGAAGLSLGALVYMGAKRLRQRSA
jgi:hypothetical protein